ncbi:MAG: hypothetical protein LBL62_09330 [Planctomycetaceae bacterium]|nr:hypothetical protein [Planctomycetaceae bacterium]
MAISLAQVPASVDKQNILKNTGFSLFYFSYRLLIGLRENQIGKKIDPPKMEFLDLIV